MSVRGLRGRRPGMPMAGLPEPYVETRLGPARIIALRGAATAVRAALVDAGQLYQYARQHATGPPFHGRSLAYPVVPPDAEPGERFGSSPATPAVWLVRHYWRGGAVARFLDDQYLRIGTPRPVRELIAAHAALERGVATPRVVAAVVYPAGLYYTADLATELVPETIDLARLSFESRLDRDHRTAAWRAAGELVARAAAAGILHRDLNLRNVLIQVPGIAAVDPLDPYPVRPRDSDAAAVEVSAVMIDLDRCAVRPPARGRRALRRAMRMAARLHRSRLKIERGYGTVVSRIHVQTFEDAWRSALARRS